MQIDASFMELVEFHERKWGLVQYPGRPALADLINGHIVAMWISGKRFMFSVHSTAHELNQIVENIVIASDSVGYPDRKLAKIFVNQQPIKFSVRIVSEKEPSQEPAHELPSDQTMPIRKQPEIAFVRPEPTIAKLIPLPKPVWIRLSPKPIAKHPGTKWGDNLPGRNPELLPGSKRGKK